MAVSAKGRIDRDDPFVVESGIRRRRAVQRLNQERRHDEEHAAGGDLHADQRLPHEGRAVTLPGRLECRREPEQDCRRESHCNGEEDDAPIRHRVQPRWRTGQRHQASQHEEAQRQPRDRSHQAQHEALGEQLANEPTHAGTNGHANRDLSLASHSSREKQTPQVAAGRSQDQEHQSADQRRHRNQLVRIPGSRSVVRIAQRASRIATRLARQALVFPDVARMFSAQLCGERSKFSLRRRGRQTRLQPAPRGNSLAFDRVVCQQLAAVDEVRLLNHREPHVRAIQTEPAELNARNANHRDRLAIQVNRAPCYQRIAAEPPLPEHVTQNDDRRGAWPFVARGIEERSDGGHGTELAEQIGSHEVRLQRRSFRFNREPRAVPRHDR